MTVTYRTFFNNTFIFIFINMYSTYEYIITISKIFVRFGKQSL